MYTARYRHRHQQQKFSRRKLKLIVNSIHNTHIAYKIITQVWFVLVVLIMIIIITVGKGNERYKLLYATNYRYRWFGASLGGRNMPRFLCLVNFS